ncbi:MAG: Gfo/Idh/MocA family protein, partial [Opitutales bacterium]
MMNQSIHTIDLMLHLVGPVKSVYASCGLEAHEGIEVEDVAVAMVEFANGARGVIQASTACYSNTGLPASIHVCGDKGSIRMCDDKFDL